MWTLGMKQETQVQEYEEANTEVKSTRFPKKTDVLKNEVD